MKLEGPAQDTDLSSVPVEFRANYTFLTELITCKDKNSLAEQDLESLVHSSIAHLRGKLNRRQMSILNRYLKGSCQEDGEGFYPPVPAELEASIRVKKRSAWLPWEAEAIRKIERWRKDIQCITESPATEIPLCCEHTRSKKLHTPRILPPKPRDLSTPTFMDGSSVNAGCGEQ